MIGKLDESVPEFFNQLFNTLENLIAVESCSEPGSAGEIAEFCTKSYGVSFQMMSKVDVKGDGQHPVYAWLCKAAQNGVGDHKVGWNFHKFLVDEEGRLVSSLKSGADPMGKEIVAFASGN